MGYTLSLHLKEGAPIDEIVKSLENSPTIKENLSVRVSSNPEEHGYANVSPSNCGVYISYSSLQIVESYLIHALIHLTVVQYGLRTKHHKVKMSVPYYMHDDTLVFVLSENQLSKLSPNQYSYKMFNDVIKKRYVVPIEPEDDRQYAYFETSKYNESPKIDNLGIVLKMIKFLGGEFKRLKVAEQEFKAIKSTLLEEYPSRIKPTEIY